MKLFIGVWTLFQFLIVLIIGGYAIWQQNPLYGQIYAGGSVLAMLAMMSTYCTKCRCRLTNCAHVFPGMVTRILPRRESAPYTKLDYAISFLPLALVVASAQFWLWSNLVLGVVYWVLLLSTGVALQKTVCPSCENCHCPMSPGT